MPCPGTYWKTSGRPSNVRRSAGRGNEAVVQVRVLRRRLRKTAGSRPAVELAGRGQPLHLAQHGQLLAAPRAVQPARREPRAVVGAQEGIVRALADRLAQQRAAQRRRHRRVTLELAQLGGAPRRLGRRLGAPQRVEIARAQHVRLWRRLGPALGPRRPVPAAAAGEQGEGREGGDRARDNSHLLTMIGADRTCEQPPDGGAFAPEREVLHVRWREKVTRG